MSGKIEYSAEPVDKKEFTASFDQFYSKFARVYDIGVRVLPFWRTWLRQTIPYIDGPLVLEVSFGTGYLLTQYAARFRSYGLDYNRMMAATAKKNLWRAGVFAHLQQGNIETLPYRSESFDSVINTMAFSGYPDGWRAMAEMRRVLKREGRLILIDVNYPPDRNWLGTKLTDLWQRSGDIIRDMGELFNRAGFSYSDQAIGGYGSVHLYVAVKKD